MIMKLYQANNAGVRIQLIVRGICSLIPGIKGMSENIEAISIVDKYLEHSRIFVFANGGDELYYLSSADWMTRNIDHRIEVSTPVFDRDLQQELRHIIDTQLRDNVKARIIDERQSNHYKSGNTERPVRSQVELTKFYTQMSLKSWP
jgi:polyphosphate kinase